MQSHGLTEELANYATTDKQRECLAAVLEHGSQRAAAKALGIAQSGLNDHLKRLKAHAARKGYAPGHFASGVPEGYLQGKVTVQRNAHGEVERTWERMSPDQMQTIAA
ncbi:LysR family transcriptional regulator [uncultured Brevundimonas sp.]|uniref:helix-turn-helix domain-containing protein n=1 Tax=uncultured Brevundimonas sp. TaxID=213418 RepID=UPI00261D973F|nr:LysR family transcriptional regulator [uncultured Brevundimonas sp.]